MVIGRNQSEKRLSAKGPKNSPKLYNQKTHRFAKDLLLQLLVHADQSGILAPLSPLRAFFQTTETENTTCSHFLGI
ncbi:MAG TPA: hypothetical protein DEB70_01575 [Planctomycetaceae bacterium]|nr:hypothetical protein [Planctomycetaceae bacterium]